MLLVPLIYLKEGKATPPVGTNPSWFSETPALLIQNLQKQDATHFFINDLNVTAVGKGPNVSALEEIKQNVPGGFWVTGNFRSMNAIETYVDIGAEKIILTGCAYQEPKLLQEAVQKFPQKIAVMIEIKNKKVVIPGMVSPAHKSANDYAKRFEDSGVTSLFYYDSDNALEESHFKAIKKFCTSTRVPVIGVLDIQNTQQLEDLFDCESAGLMGIVIGKPLYENKVDLKSLIAFLSELGAEPSHEITVRPE